MSFEQTDTIANNIWLSLNVRRGSFFARPEFGMRELPNKNTPRAAALIEQYAKEALQWILDLGRATSIAVEAERDPVNHPNRIILRGEAVQADGRQISFEHFVEVV